MKNIARLFAFLIALPLLTSQTSFAQTIEDSTSVMGKAIDTLAQHEKTTPHKYRMNYWVSGGLSLAATAANIYAIPNIIKSKQNFSDAELQSLNPDAMNDFDRWALHQDPTQRDQFYQASDYALPVIIVSAGVLGFDKKIRKDWFRILMMYYEMHAVTFSLYNFSFFGPAFQNKPRPYVYYNNFTLDERRGGNNRNSMYSGHTATAAASTFFAVKVYSDYHPELGRKKYLLYALASVPPLAEGYLRMRALAHFPADIMIGFMIGATVGVVVPELHKFKDRNFHIGLAPTPGGAGINLSWVPESTPKEVFHF